MLLFLSYASDDRPVAEKLCDYFSQSIDVFMDTKSIPGGAEWERNIDKAIHRCKVFAPIVTNASNNSTWVAKETLLALSLDIPILPLLYSDSLPLRIVDLQFIDFRGNFEAGLSDFLSSLKEYMGPLRHSRESIDNNIAKAIRARLNDDIREANALIEQIVGPESELASSSYTFWRKLQSSMETNLANSVGPQLIIKETTNILADEQYDDRKAYEWTLELHSADDDLKSIDAVVYTLHPTFNNPIQKVRSYEDHFKLRKIGWGTFTVHIHVEFVDHSAFDGSYKLTFKKNNEEPLSS